MRVVGTRYFVHAEAIVSAIESAAHVVETAAKAHGKVSVVLDLREDYREITILLGILDELLDGPLGVAFEIAACR
jgi:hypothetical protein